MTKENLPLGRGRKITYWIFTVWLALGLVSSGIVQLIKIEDETKMFANLGYPVYLLTFLGISKLLAMVAVVVPKFPMVKEWAYAGIAFTMLGALYSHVLVGDPFGEIFPPILFLIITFMSWYFRPADRKVNLATTNETR